MTRMFRHSFQISGTVALLLAGSGLTLWAGDGPERDTAPSGRGVGTLNHPSQSQANNQAGNSNRLGGANGILLHGGPVMTNGVRVYYIWYGNWSATSVSILTDLAKSIGGSPYFNINTTYYNSVNIPVKNSVTFTDQQQISVGYPYGTSLSDAQIQAVVANAINGGKLPKDTDGVYFVLTSSDVTATSGFCSQYCGWHTHATISGADIKYSFVGNAARCPSACAAQSTSPNNDVGADAAASILAHELEEAVTDPDLNAWYDVRGNENADKCAWTFGSISYAPNGSKYNTTMSYKDSNNSTVSRNFLIQQNWVNSGGGYCAMSF